MDKMTMMPVGYPCHFVFIHSLVTVVFSLQPPIINALTYLDSFCTRLRLSNVHIHIARPSPAGPRLPAARSSASYWMHYYYCYCLFRQC
ncbi:hypothetical protein BDW66DRAFT_128165 [Aspergillus desertorum]